MVLAGEAKPMFVGTEGASKCIESSGLFVAEGTPEVRERGLEPRSPTAQRPSGPAAQRPSGPAAQRPVASVAPRRLHQHHGGLPLPQAASGCHSPLHHAPLTTLPRAPLPPTRYDNAPGAEHKCCKTGTGLARLVEASWTIVSKHLGSLAVGAFVIALCQTLRLGMKLLDNMTQKVCLPYPALPSHAPTPPRVRRLQP